MLEVPWKSVNERENRNALFINSGTGQPPEQQPVNTNHSKPRHHFGVTSTYNRCSTTAGGATAYRQGSIEYEALP
jgi:hypothetical protein